MRLLQEALHLWESSGRVESLKNQITGSLAIARIAAGDTTAIADLERAISTSQALDDVYGAAFLSEALGKILLEKGDLDRAAQSLIPAVSYYRGNAMRPYLARSLPLLAQLYERQGRLAEAAEVHAEIATLAQPVSAAS